MGPLPVDDRAKSKMSVTLITGIGAERVDARAPACEGIAVFVLLGHGFGLTQWRKRHARGEIAGLNEPFPYGYDHAAGEGWSIVYSEDGAEYGAARLLRRSLTRLLGFDLIHAWRNREQLFAADVVWAHTEREHLAALLLRWLRMRGGAPAIVAECIWLPDRWHRFSWPRRALYRWLLGRADAVTCQSEGGVRWLRQMLPDSRVEWVPGGAKASFMRRPCRRPAHSPVRLVALGSDMHRDWPTLLSAFGGVEGFELRVASGRGGIRVRRDAANVSVAAARTEAEVRWLYDWADVVVMPLQPNLHASGSR